MVSRGLVPPAGLCTRRSLCLKHPHQWLQLVPGILAPGPSSGKPAAARQPPAFLSKPYTMGPVSCISAGLLGAWTQPGTWPCAKTLTRHSRSLAGREMMTSSFRTSWTMKPTSSLSERSWAWGQMGGSVIRKPLVLPCPPWGPLNPALPCPHAHPAAASPASPASPGSSGR